MSDTLLRQAEALSPWLQETFFALHRQPELGRQEHKTAAFVKAELEKLGIEALPIADTGVLGILRGGKPGPTVGFRADMDALPIVEESGLPYASQVPGVMHACGHDFHVTALLGAAKLLAERREELAGCVKFFFQPNEEGDGGADRMIKAGCLENPKVDAAFCVHVDSEYPTGSIRVRSGPVTAASNYFELIFRGRGTHGARPHKGSDVIVAASQAVTALQTISSRRLDPTSPAVVTVGSFHAGTAGNIIPEEAKLTGIIRTMGREARQMAKDAFRAIVEGIAAAMDVEAELTITDSYPSTQNDAEMTALVRSAAVKLLGEARVGEKTEVTLGADDFGYFTEAVPGCYFWIGVGNREKYGGVYPIHNPRFAADPDSLPVASAVFTQIVFDYFEKH